jgi:regulator of cell morphogenesis and NO signaling
MMMTATTDATAEKTVRELALEIPQAARIFESLGIDYCCGGAKPLGEACQAVGVPASQVLAMLEEARQKNEPSPDRDWQTARLTELITHIVSTHHAYLQQELPRIGNLFTKVCAAHAARHGELREMQSVFAALADELRAHLMKEEQILFPYLVQQERGESPHACFGSVQGPIRMMMFEHDSAGEALRRLRTLSSNYALPADACLSYGKLYEALRGLEADLHRHIHLENNILFPRAIATEQA